MFKLKLINSFLFLFIKYCIFFFIIAFIGDRFKNVVINNAHTPAEMIKLTMGYILYVLSYSLPLIVVLLFPLHYILKIRSGLYFIFAMILFFAIEYVIYTYFYSPSNKSLGIYNFIIGIICIALFFYRSILAKFNYV